MPSRYSLWARSRNRRQRRDAAHHTGPAAIVEIDVGANFGPFSVIDDYRVRRTHSGAQLGKSLATTWRRHLRFIRAVGDFKNVAMSAV